MKKRITVPPTPALYLHFNTNNKVPEIKESYLGSGTLRTDRKISKDVQQRIIQQTADAHYGYTEIKDENITIVIPIDVTKERPKKENEERAQIGIKRDEIPEEYWERGDEEISLLQEVKKHLKKHRKD